MKKIACFIFWGAFLGSSLFAGGFARAADAPEVMSFATKPVGTTIYMIAAGMNQIFNKYGGVKVTVEPTMSVKQWGSLMTSGQMDLAMDNAVDSGGAYRATDLFKVGNSKLTSFRLLAAGHETFMTFWTRPDLGIKTVPDFAGKRVVWDAPAGAPTAIVIGTYLVDEYYQMKGKYKRLTLGSPAECVNALIEGRIDVYQFPPTAHVEELKRSVGYLGIPIPKEAAEFVGQKVPGMYPGVIPKGLSGVTEDIPCIAFRGQLFAREGLDAKLVYRLLDVMYSHLDELHPVHAIAKEWVLENATKNATVPFHAGAIQYYKDKGIWSAALDKQQERLIEDGK